MKLLIILVEPMNSIKVDLRETPYTINIEHGLLSKMSKLLAKYNNGQKWIIITQPNIAELHGYLLLESLKRFGFNAQILTVPDGEHTKKLSQIEKLYNQLLELQCDRSTMLIAMGGGVIGDITGFLAATFMRGIKYIQIPTTLLAMIDSSIGGKTGINLEKGKNLVGAIYQPQAVLIDPEILATLPTRELISGFGEMLKYGLIKDINFFELLSDSNFIFELNDNKKVEEAIAISCEIKAKIVTKDEREQGLRQILNFGHTIGHAFEIFGNYELLKHGEAVAYGMLCSSWISCKNDLISENEFEQIESIIRNISLPKLPSLPKEQMLELIRRDKKFKNGKLNFVLLNGIGKAIISDQVSENDILHSIDYLTKL